MPASPTPHLRIGELYLRRERPDLAEGEFRQARRQDPRQVKALVRLGRSLSQQAPTEARAALAEALSLAPHSAEIHYQMGITCWHQERFQEAAEAFRRAEGEKDEARWAQAARYRQGLLAVAAEDLPAAQARLTQVTPAPGAEVAQVAKEILAHLETAEGAGDAAYRAGRLQSPSCGRVSQP